MNSTQGFSSGSFPPWRSSSPLLDSDLIDYVPNNNLRELISGKTIAYVCPAPNLVGLNSGSFIDSHDVVVRAGNLRDISPNLFCDYGERTDILVHSFNEFEIPEAKRNPEFFQNFKLMLDRR